MLQEKSLPYQPGSHTVIRKHRTDQAETVTPSEAKSSHCSAEYCSQYSIRAVALLNLGGAIAQFQRNDCSIPPVEVISGSGVRTSMIRLPVRYPKHICGALNCDIVDVIALEQDEDNQIEE